MPQNADFMWAAYAVATVAYLVYGASLWWRSRELDRRERDLERAPTAGTTRGADR